MGEGRLEGKIKGPGCCDGWLLEAEIQDAGDSQRSEERGAKASRVMIPILFPGIRRRSKAQSNIDRREIDSSWHGIYPT